MNVLSLDTASPSPAVSLLVEGRLIEETLASDRRASDELLPTVRRLLAEAGTDLSRIERIAVCAGPGSFTGVRVGLATAWGFGRANAIPVEAVSTLEAMAEASRSRSVTRIVAVLEAGRGEVVCARFRLDGPRAAPLGPLERLSPEEARRFVCGDSVAALPATLLGPGGTAPESLPASALALAVARAPRSGAPGALEAIYARPSAAEEKHGAA